MVPVVDLSRRTAALTGEYLEAVRRVLCSGRLLLGAELDGFESAFASFTGHRHAVGVASGASALQLALAALGIGRGDEVIVPAFTAVPTASAVCAVGATPVPVDVEASTAAINPAAIDDARTPRTRAIIAVHLYGRPVDLAPIAALGIPVIEDAAQAHGALEPSGSAAACYSFYPTKNLGGIGDGGAVVTNDAELATAVRRLRVHGTVSDYVHTEISQNFRVSELEAAWLTLALPHLAPGNERRRVIARAYRAAAPSLRWPQDHPRHAYHLCVVRVGGRDRFRAALSESGIATSVQYPLALTGQPAYRAFARHRCPCAEAWADECVTLPCFPELTDAEIERVSAVLANVATHGPW